MMRIGEDGEDGATMSHDLSSHMTLSQQENPLFPHLFLLFNSLDLKE